MLIFKKCADLKIMCSQQLLKLPWPFLPLLLSSIVVILALVPIVTLVTVVIFVVVQ